MEPDKRKKIMSFLQSNRLLLALLLAGFCLLLFAPRSRSESSSADTLGTERELRLASALKRSQGVGECVVLLSEENGRSGGITGAVIICEGADSPAVRLRIVKAVGAYTQLGSDRIVVQKMTS